MPVKVGNSYVSEAAYEYAKSQVDEGGDMLKSLAEKFPNLKFSVGTAPFNGSGLNNVAIAPNILREMESDPDKRLEYEALLYDVANMPLPANANLKAHGAIIGKDGGLSMWGISGGDDTRAKVSLKRDDKKTWWAQLLEKLNESRKKSSESSRVEISTEGKDALKNNKVDDTAESSNGKVAFNAAKRARQLAAATSKSQVRAIINLLQTDLQECEEGVKNNMCDEDEVKKVQKMIQQAEKRLSEVDDEEPKFSVDVLI